MSDDEFRSCKRDSKMTLMPYSFSAVVAVGYGAGNHARLFGLEPHNENWPALPRCF
jgi:hypothetical protein